MKIGLGEKIEIQPCTEEGLVTLEAKLGEKEEMEYFDPEVMGTALKYAPFKDIKFSKEMGYAFALYEGKRIHIFKQGKIVIRRANDTDDALNVLKMCVKSLLPAIICDPRIPTIFCYKGMYEECLNDCQPLKKLILGKTHTMRFMDILKNPPVEIQDRKVGLERLSQSIKVGGIRAMDYPGFIESERRAVYRTMIESEDHIVISTCLSLLALYDNLEEILNMLFAEERVSKIHEVLDLIRGTLGAIMNGDTQELESMKKMNEEIRSRTTKVNLMRALTCIQNVARAAQKTVLR